MSSNSSGTSTGAVVATTLGALAASAVAYRTLQQHWERRERAKWVEHAIFQQWRQAGRHGSRDFENDHDEVDELASIDSSKDESVKKDETLPGIWEHFKELQLDYDCSIDEANKRRTTKYYELARDSHMYDLCPGVRSYPRLRNRREAELKRIYRYHHGNLRHPGKAKSHRTVICMCDTATAGLLGEARNSILEPLQYSHDITTSKVWIPKANVLPLEHLHVTMAIPWWWHTIRPGNEELSSQLLARFKQALVLEFHHAFQIELERIVLLGGKSLVALWRTVGEREAEDNYTIFDRHGEGNDPVVKLRKDIVKCFTTRASEFGKEPLTYSHLYSNDPLSSPRKSSIQNGQPNNNNNNNNNNTAQPPPAAGPRNETLQENPAKRPPPPRVLKRQNTIELKTPGLGDHDGFVHTTLARLPLDCLSMTDVELEAVHRRCREATATYCGHRMVVSKFRFLETTGAGGESNPCVEPIFDETVIAPPRVQIQNGTNIIHIHDNLHTAKVVDRSATIGNLPPVSSYNTTEGLFEVPASSSSSPKLKPFPDKPFLERILSGDGMDDEAVAPERPERLMPVRTASDSDALSAMTPASNGGVTFTNQPGRAPLASLPVCTSPTGGKATIPGGRSVALL